MRNDFKVVDMVPDTFEVGLQHPAGDRLFAPEPGDVFNHDSQGHVRGHMVGKREEKVAAVPGLAAPFFQSFFGYPQR